MWTVAVLVTLYSLISSAMHGPAITDTSIFHAKLANPTITSTIR
jgi:hypothetical protein